MTEKNIKYSIEKFIQVMSPKYPMVYRAISTEWIPSIVSKTIIDKITDKNIYFLWWVDPDATSLRDSSIKEIHYIRLDIDIRKQCIEFLEASPDEDEILTFISDIKDILEWDDFLKEWSYITYSWWGCHIYYSNKEWIIVNNTIMTPKVWQLAMKRIYTLYDNTIGELHQYLYSDKAVCNTARIMRLPWTINQKYWVKCSIVYENPNRQSRFFKYVERIWLDELKKRDVISKKRELEIIEMKKNLIANWWTNTDLKYEIINRFPAYIIAQILLPQFNFDWKKNFKVNWKLKWYYYVSETNSICNWWSEEFAWWTSESCWNNFALIQRHLWLNKTETFKWFESKFNI